tara:strand:+ start:288 stop:539 length:252 start_codon:yes stop_codon:yes gene_type:complete
MKNTGKKILLKSGIKFRTSELGYYDVWYPSMKEVCLVEDIVVTPVSTHKVSMKAGWIPCKVEPEVANQYGTQSRIIWILSGEE